MNKENYKNPLIQFLIEDTEKRQTFFLKNKPLRLKKFIDTSYEVLFVPFIYAQFEWLRPDGGNAIYYINVIDYQIQGVHDKFLILRNNNGDELYMDANRYYQMRALIFLAFEGYRDEAKLAIVNQYMFTAINLIDNSRKSTTDEYRDVYSFRRVNEYTLKDLADNTITVSNPAMMNDKVDSIILHWLEATRFKRKEYVREVTQQFKYRFDTIMSYLSLYDELIKSMRIRSFVYDSPKSSPINNPLMWAHYTENSEGVGFCVKYRLSKNFYANLQPDQFRLLKRINYIDSNKRIDLNSFEDMTLGLSFFTKSKFWSYENEIRLLSFCPNGPGGDFNAIPLDKDSYISEIYFGIDCTNESKEKVMDALNNHDNITFYQMEADYSNLYTPLTRTMLVSISDSNSLAVLEALFSDADEKFNYDKAYYYTEGLILVSKNEKFGFIDGEGKLAIECKYDRCNSFNEGLAPVCMTKGYSDFWGFIDKKGTLLIDCIYDEANFFENGFAAVQKNDSWGFINKEGHAITEFIFSEVGSFNEGLAKVQLDSLWGFINERGQIVISCIYDSVGDFHQGLAWVYNGDNWGFINKSGQIIVDLIYQDAGNFCDDMAPVKLNDKWGFINTSGNLVIKPFYSEAHEFSEGIACVSKYNPIIRQELWGAIDKSGNEIIQFKYDHLDDFHEGLATARVFCGGNLCFGFINHMGTMVIPYRFESALDFNDGLAVISYNGKYGYVNKNGELIPEGLCSYAYPFNDGLGRVYINDEYRFIDKKGNFVI